LYRLSRHPLYTSSIANYGTTNDLFFSGHTSIAVWGGLEISRLRFRGAGLLGLLVAVFEAITVIVLRAHYTMDVFTGVVVALLINAYVDRWARPIDQWFDRPIAPASAVVATK
jgi:membrane-associated phospholipid phosphatase